MSQDTVRAAPSSGNSRNKFSKSKAKFLEQQRKDRETAKAVAKIEAQPHAIERAIMRSMDESARYANGEVTVYGERPEDVTEASSSDDDDDSSDDDDASEDDDEDEPTAATELPTSRQPLSPTIPRDNEDADDEDDEDDSSTSSHATSDFDSKLDFVHEVVPNDLGGYPSGKRPRDDGSEHMLPQDSFKRQKIARPEPQEQSLTVVRSSEEERGRMSRTSTSPVRYVSSNTVPEDWPHLRSASKFEALTVSEQAATLQNWMHETDEYISSIGAGAVPARKVSRFFRRIDAYLKATALALDDVHLAHQRSIDLDTRISETLELASLERSEMAELLGRFNLPSASAVVRRSW